MSQNERYPYAGEFTTSTQDTAELDAQNLYPVLYISDMYNRPVPDWLIQRMLPSGSSAYLYGDDGTCKTGLAGEIGLRMSYALEDWFNNQLKAGVVAIVVGEGDDNIGRMIQAFLIKYEQEYGLSRENKNLIIIPEGVALDKPAAMVKLAKTLHARLQGRSLQLIIFDTLSTCLEDADPDRNSDMIKVNRNMRTLQKLFGCSTWIVHHTGKDNNRGMRGASDLRRSADVVMYMEHIVDKDGRDVYKLTVEKLKGHQKPIEPLYFKQDIIDLDEQNNFGDAETGYVLIPTNYVSATVQHIRDNVALAREILKTQGQLNNGQWMEQCKQIDINRKEFERIRDTLLKDGKVLESLGGEKNRNRMFDWCETKEEEAERVNREMKAERKQVEFDLSLDGLDVANVFDE